MLVMPARASADRSINLLLKCARIAYSRSNRNCRICSIAPETQKSGGRNFASRSALLWAHFLAKPVRESVTVSRSGPSYLSPWSRRNSAVCPLFFQFHLSPTLSYSGASQLGLCHLSHV